MRKPIIILVCFLYVAVGFGVMFPALDNWFLGDDLAWLAQAKESKSLLTMIGGSPWDGYFRPTYHALIWMEWKLFRTNPIWYHGVSVFLHIACGALLALLLFLVTRHTWLSFLSGITFLVLSPGSEAVYWISAQSALLAVFLIEASLCLLILSHDRRTVGLVISGFVLYVLALGSLAAASAGLACILWLALGRKRYLVGAIFAVLTAAHVVTYRSLSPELAGRVLQLKEMTGLFESYARSVVEAYARAADAVGGRWAVGIGLAAATSVLGWRTRGVRYVHWIVIVALIPYALTLMRHQSQSSTLSFDRYFYVARPGLSILVALLLVQLCAAAWRTRAKVLAVVPVVIFLLFWAPSHVKVSRKMDLLYGTPSLRLGNAIAEIQAIDPGSPVRVVLKGFAVPECWLVPKVGTLFFESRLRCDQSDSETKIHVVRERDSTLRWNEPSSPDSTG